MKLGDVNAHFRPNADTSSMLKTQTPVSFTFLSKDASEGLGNANGEGVTLEQVINIFNTYITNTNISQLLDVNNLVDNAPSGSLFIMGTDGKWTYNSPYSYTLMPATTIDLGGVIIGDNINVDVNGIISVADPYEYWVLGNDITYYSIQKSGIATKNDCGSGYSGSDVEYIVSAGAYTSIISQEDADAQAQADITANGQTYANDNGECTLIPTPFITTWKTDNSGSSTNHQVTLPLYNVGTYDFIVDWGDETTSHITSWDQAEVTHTYSEIGTYTVTITGAITGWRFANTGDKLKILDISQWGCLHLVDKIAEYAGWFMGCANMECSATDIPDISGATGFDDIFYGCSSFNGDLSGWDVSNITSMGATFHGCSVFNSDLSSWNVSNVANMSGMFFGCSSFTSDLSSWNVSNVNSMATMFMGCSSFTSDLSSWNVSNVLNMNRMFYFCSSFISDLSGWDVSNITDMSYMFRFCSLFDSDLSNWDISSIVYNVLNYPETAMYKTFDGTSLTTEHYSAMLNAWALLVVNPNVLLGVGSTQYNAGAVAARAVLTGAPNNWVITDGGLET